RSATRSASAATTPASRSARSHAADSQDRDLDSVTRTDKALRAAFCEAEQGHVFRFFDELPADEQATLMAQLRSIDLKRVRRLIEQHLAGHGSAEAPALSPAPIIAPPSTEAAGGGQEPQGGRGGAARRTRRRARRRRRPGDAAGVRRPEGNLPDRPGEREVAVPDPRGEGARAGAPPRQGGAAAAARLARQPR